MKNYNIPHWRLSWPLIRWQLLFPILFGENPEPIQMYHGTNWAESIYYGDIATKVRDRYITIHQFLELEPPGAKRSIFVKESRKLEDLDFSGLK